MNTLNEIAQHIMDAYYQEDKSGDDFFDLPHFRFMAASSYANLLQDEFEKSKRATMQEEGRAEAQLNPEWYTREDVDIKLDAEGKGVAVLLNPVFSFRYDKRTSGVLDIYQLVGNCTEFMRIHPEALWQLKILPKTSITYWYMLMMSTVYFVNTLPKKVRIFYIPAITDDNDPVIPLSLGKMIVQDVWTFFVNAKNGVVVDMTDNQNPNKNMETEILEYLKQRSNA
jgi:hypothetical protein